MLSKSECMKCNRGMMRLQQDAYSTYFTCVTCGATKVTRCPHCETPSIAIDMSPPSPTVYCRACECANAKLAAAECSQGQVPAAMRSAG